EVLRVLLGHHAAAVATTLARLDVPEALAKGARTFGDVAILTGTTSVGMLRLLRAAASLGLVDERDRGTFAANARTECLGRAPGSLRDVSIALTDAGGSRLLQHLPDAVMK